MKKTVVLLALCCLCGIVQSQTLALAAFEQSVGPYLTGSGFSSDTFFHLCILLVAGAVCGWLLMGRCVLGACAKINPTEM